MTELLAEAFAKLEQFWIALINSNDDFRGSALLVMRQLQEKKC